MLPSLRRDTNLIVGAVVVVRVEVVLVLVNLGIRFGRDIALDLLIAGPGGRRNYPAEATIQGVLRKSTYGSHIPAVISWGYEILMAR